MSAPLADAGSAAMWPPGTVQLEESNRTIHEIILQPRPTEDPNDPLNWSKVRKYINFAFVCFYVLMVNEFLNAATPTWGPMNKELGFSYEILNDSYAVGCAFLAIGALVLVPFALKFGRRPLYLFSTMLQFGLSIWAAKMTTVADLMLINILQCAFGALAEVIVQMTVADVFFVHQRGTMNSIYIWVFNMSSSLGPLIAGFIAKAQGWRWVWWWNAIIFGVTISLVAFGYEETKFNPSSVPTFLPGQSPETDANQLSNSISSKSADVATAKPKDIEEGPKEVEEGSRQLGPVTINLNIPRKTYLQKLAITTPSGSDGNNSLLRHMYQPLILLGTIPAVAWTALVYGILVALADVMSTILSSFMTKPPYNFDSSQIGMMNIPKIIGSTLGSLIAGPFSDWLVVYLARRNNGVYEPEMRLWAIVPFIFLVPIGSLMFGIGLNNKVPWPAITVGLGLYRAGIAPISGITITYLTDSYKDVIGDGLVGVTIVRNVFSTAFIFALSPWVAAVGIKYVLVTIVLIATVILSFLAVFIIFGKIFRARSAARYKYYAARQYKERAL
ncbi:Uncharacterized protein BP5553_09202 [Venustampulla echinocandica]|uniref:Major facilitator superfamily (MFS) profile domain-containing protein n=1 Tax=Venustampulla echinocandica TaxID=2656787 RepID=A0A370TC19_9HELO|nr:Uncharacterized protein BP5553_09202 [Venustampulla echinocandica]RDL31800.1 Uncharacterized protein BP5553_09202 [Venustampulla echinocandica]